MGRIARENVGPNLEERNALLQGFGLTGKLFAGRRKFFGGAGILLGCFGQLPHRAPNL
jgi:hypothetical protein